MKHTTKRKTLRRKTLRRIHGGAEKNNGGTEKNNGGTEKNNGGAKKRKAGQNINGGGESLSRNSPKSRSEGFYSALSNKEKKNKSNATIKLAINVEKRRLKEGYLRLIAPSKHGSIQSEKRLPYFLLAQQIITRIIDETPTDEDVNIYASHITEDIAPTLEGFLKYNNDTYNSELLKFMQSHNLSTLK